MGMMAVERMESKNPYQGLFNELKEEYGLSPIEAKALVKRVELFKEEMSSGVRDHNQIVRQVVVNGEPAGKRIRDCRLIPVTLTMNFNGEEKVEQKNGLSYLKKMKVHQLAWEAYEQGGLLSYEDIESILGISISTIKRYIKQYRIEGVVVPTRGQIEDIGPGITHKEKIIELLVKGYTYSEVMIQTAHTEASVENYEKKFVRIAYFHREGKNKLLIRTLTGYSEYLIDSYIELYTKYSQEYPDSLNKMLERFHRYIDCEQEKILGTNGHMINNCKNDSRQHYVPGAKLTYATMLKQMLKQELGYQGKPKILDLLATEIENITKECYVDKNYIGLGQIKVVVPSIHDKPSWSQNIEDTALVTVTLTLHSSEDTEALKANKPSRLITQDKLMRIAKEAIEQEGVLSSAVAASLLNIKQTTVSKYVKEYFEREGRIVPLRGFVHDMGKTTTHKRWIIELYLNGYTTKQIQSRTDHKIVSIDRYIKRYKAVENIIEEIKTVDSIKISRLLDISVHSAREYTAIYLEYRDTAKIKRLDFFKDIEAITQKTINSVDKYEK